MDSELWNKLKKKNYGVICKGLKIKYNTHF